MPVRPFKSRCVALLTALLPVAFLAGCQTILSPDSTRPTVTSTNPADGATNVAVSSTIVASFSEAMDPTTLTTATLSVRKGNVAVAGVVTYANATATFTPTDDLEPNTIYTGRVTTAATDLSGNSLAANFLWNFTTATGSVPDITAPTVTFTAPAGDDVGVPINSTIVVSFSEAMDATTLTTGTFTVLDGGDSVSGVVTYAGMHATFTPTNDLAANTTYTARVTTGATDLTGNPLANDFEWSFATGSVSDTAAPTVTFTAPADNDNGVPFNSTIVASFSEAMDPTTLTTGTFTVLVGGNSVSGVVTYAGANATFTPTNTLAANTTYTARVTTGATDLSGNPLASDFEWSFATGAAPDTTAPRLNFTAPADDDVDVPINSTIVASFSEAMDPTTLTTATFIVLNGFDSVAGVVTYAGANATFTPTNTLAPNTTYTARVTTGATDLRDNPLASDFEWSFTTGAAPDTTAPTVAFTAPAADDINVPISSTIVASFSEAMDPTTLTTATFIVLNGFDSVAGVVTYAGANATFTPTNDLAPNTIYTARVTTGATDLAGNPLASDFEWIFTTGAAPDTTAPTVTFTVPTDDASNVVINPNIVSTFSEEMDPTTLTIATFTLTDGQNFVSGAVNYAGDSATFTPTENLAPNTFYTARVTTGATDLTGNPLASDFTWSFSTGMQQAEASIALQSAGTFAVLGGSGVTNTGSTVLTGDLGVSPGTSITGFPPGILSGTIHAGDFIASDAKFDLQSAYDDAALRSGSPIAVAGNLGGLTLAPGLYRSTSSLEISLGDLTLDAQGDVNGVFIFQMASTLTTTTSRQIILAGGAKAANIYWQVGSSATIGVDSVFKGNLLVLESITLNTGASLEGRALAQNGAVALDFNAISVPAP